MLATPSIFAQKKGEWLQVPFLCILRRALIATPQDTEADDAVARVDEGDVRRLPGGGVALHEDVLSDERLTVCVCTSQHSRLLWAITKSWNVRFCRALIQRSALACLSLKYSLAGFIV